MHFHSHPRRVGRTAWPLLLLGLATVALPGGVETVQAAPQKSPASRMSSMGRLGYNYWHQRLSAGAQSSGRLHSFGSGLPNGQDGGGIEFQDPDTPVLAGNLAETTIAVDSTGKHVVVGYNDPRGFNTNPVSLSGYAYSDDGGKTFTEGGTLPSPGTDVFPDGTALPQIYGDPDVKYLGGSTFIYSSIEFKKFNPHGAPATAVQTMCVHRSTDYGHTWTGPYEVKAATNPHGQTDTYGNPLDAADKEFIDVDPKTGRVVITWTNFTPFAPGGAEIRSAYSDNGGFTWSAGTVIGNLDIDGTGSMPAFSGDGKAYAVWTQYTGSLYPYGQNIGYARSTDNGKTWSTETSLTTDFVTMDQVLGNDRVHCFPAIAVNRSPGVHKGNVYLVYANNNNQDGADIAYQRSTDGGLTFSKPVLLDARPGHDRAQWFPTVAVDKTTGRVSVFYFDQGVATSGDLMQATVVYSDDGGVTWTRPSPLSDRPYHAGWGNDTGQPNLGDYNRATAQGGDLFSAFAITQSKPFTDGQDTADPFQFTTPDVTVTRTSGPRLSVSLGAVSFQPSSHGSASSVSVTLPLMNYVTNPVVSAATLTGLTGTLSSSTPGVTVTQAASTYPNLAPGASSAGARRYVLQLSSAYVPGTPVELSLAVNSVQGTATLLYSLPLGKPLPTPLLTENFSEAGLNGALPNGWTYRHGTGDNAIPWVTAPASLLVPGAKGGVAYHEEANDGPAGGSNSRWERLRSPTITVPNDAQDVTLDFDVAYATEDDPFFNIQAYDGFFLRITDLTPGHAARSVLAEAFATDFTTGPLYHYPKHFPRSSDTNYFDDMSAWAGLSDGFQHVHLRLPGMAGCTVQLRFEYTQDAAGLCSDVHPGVTNCGVALTNVVMNSVVYGH